jgi:hypothetical protein
MKLSIDDDDDDDTCGAFLTSITFSPNIEKHNFYFRKTEFLFLQ